MAVDEQRVLLNGRNRLKNTCPQNLRNRSTRYSTWLTLMVTVVQPPELADVLRLAQPIPKQEQLVYEGPSQTGSAGTAQHCYCW